MMYFKQLLAGVDFAAGDPIAAQMVNHVYVIGDRETREAMLVDPAWAVGDLITTVESDGMKLVGVLATHCHPDHVGGSAFGHQVEGICELLEKRSVAIHVQRAEAPWIKRVTGVSDSDLSLHDSGDTVQIGEIGVRLIHTPGHTPGSQCFLVESCLVAGDTLFLQGCGRTDLPGGDSSQLYRSLTQKLAEVPDGAILFPGHRYAPQASATMGETRRVNAVFKPRTEAEWLSMFS